MKDLLTATHVIDLRDHDPRMTIQVGVALSDVEIKFLPPGDSVQPNSKPA